LIADKGYASLTMQALAREVGMKLASLQYHFRSSDDLIRAVVGYIAESYHQSFSSIQKNNVTVGLHEVARFILDDEAGKVFSADKLWPQLWAMQQVQPLVSDLIDNIYVRYVETLEEALRATGAFAPRAEALFLMSFLEGATLFMGDGRGWGKEAKAFRRTVLEFIENKSGVTS